MEKFAFLPVWIKLKEWKAAKLKRTELCFSLKLNFYGKLIFININIVQVNNELFESTTIKDISPYFASRKLKKKINSCFQ